jgi:tight adherence protein C
MSELLTFLANDPVTLFLALGASTLMGAAMLGLQWGSVRADVKRRAARASISIAGSSEPIQAPSERDALLQRVTTSVDRLFGEGDAAASKVLRKKLVQAGYYQSSAPALFLTIRVGALAVLGALGFLLGSINGEHITNIYMKMVLGAGVGYFAPTLILDQILKKRQDEHRAGFPDFLDLMIVCCEAGLSMEASVNRVCREMADSYPSLSANLYFATLEIRAGRSMNDALSNLGERLGIEEARTFATLLQQSAELGSSLVDSLKIYSEEMRNKRMMRAEEKANALPSKMVIPMMIFIFPILFIILLFPAYMRVKAMWI